MAIYELGNLFLLIGKLKTVACIIPWNFCCYQIDLIWSGKIRGDLCKLINWQIFQLKIKVSTCFFICTLTSQIKPFKITQQHVHHKLYFLLAIKPSHTKTVAKTVHQIEQAGRLPYFDESFRLIVTTGRGGREK